jgi:hypothetical protein
MIDAFRRGNESTAPWHRRWLARWDDETPAHDIASDKQPSGGLAGLARSKID